MLTIFKLFTELVTILLLFYVLFYFVPELCGILVPRPGIESSPPALEGKVLTTGPPGKSLNQVSTAFPKALEHASKVLIQGTTSYQVTFCL